MNTPAAPTTYGLEPDLEPMDRAMGLLLERVYAKESQDLEREYPEIFGLPPQEDKPAEDVSESA